MFSTSPLRISFVYHRGTMPPSSNSTPRRPRPKSAAPSRSAQSPSAAPRSRSGARQGAGRQSDRTYDLTEPRQPAGGRPAGARSEGARAKKPGSGPPTDAGVRRRELKKKRGRQSTMLGWTVAAVATVMIGGMAAGVLSELHSAEGRVSQKRATLADLKTQFEIGKKRLGALSSASGKERVLVENGFVKPGERLLLFPKDSPPESGKNQ
ncbi:hypothetical protein EON80_09575 [bacterium]|nr:MAG: hypothetical protein EON80_09575 [bacterium]